MAKSNALRQQEKRAKAKKREQELGEVIVRLPLPKGTGAALSELMEWGGFEDMREAVATMLHRVHELGREGAMPLLEVTRHEYVPTETVLRHLRIAADEQAD